MTFLLVALSIAGAAPQTPADQPIVITGTPLSSTQHNLEACLARHCSPKEDIDASLAQAENLFVAGNYDAAAGVLRKSVSRNRRYAKSFPVDVADLYRSLSRVEIHLGAPDRYRFAVTSIRDSLRAGLPDNDPRVIGSLFELAEMHAELGHAESSRTRYLDAEKQANAIGRRDLAAAARMRRAWLAHLMEDDGLARRELSSIVADPDPAVRTSRLAAMVLLSQMDRSDRGTGLDALIGELRAAKLSEPVLLFNPAFDTPPLEQGALGSWIDVGFWVRPDGHVRDVEILRRKNDASWAKSLLKSINGRIYGPVDDAAGRYKVERYTFTSFLTERSGTRIKVRSERARIEFLDLTADGGGSGAQQR